MTPHEMLTALDDALAHRAPARVIVVELTVSMVRFTDPPMVFMGKPIPQVDGSRVYGYTRKQCEQMRAVILAAAAEDVRER